MQLQKVEWQAETKTTSCTSYLNTQSMQHQGSLPLGNSAGRVRYKMLMTNGMVYIFHAEHEDEFQLLQGLDEFIQCSNTKKKNLSKLGRSIGSPKLIGLI